MTDDAVTHQEAGDSLIVEGQRFAIVPEWVIDADIGDCAFRLYAVLLRYGQSSGVRMPSRATLARRLHKRSVDTVDRAMKELVAAGAVLVERRRDGKQNLTNRYHVRTSGPGRTAAAASPASTGSGTIAAACSAPAATPGRIITATPAAPLRPDPESSTDEHPPPTVGALADRCRALRRTLGLPGIRWSDSAVAAAVQRCRERNWPEQLVERAVERVAADPATRSPFRAAEAGPWWESAGATDVAQPGQVPHGEDLAALEAELDACDGLRTVLQREARAELGAEGLPLTRETVVRRAVQLLRST